DVLGRAALLRAAGGGDDAVRAELVAPDLDADVSLKSARPHGRVAGRVVTDEAGLDLVPAGIRAAEAQRVLRLAGLLHPLDEFGDAGELAGADDHIDIGGAFADRVLVLLGHAPEYADDGGRVAPLDVLHAAECRIRLVLGVLADGAGVKEQHVGVG